jgi:hypothetical protein
MTVESYLKSHDCSDLYFVNLNYTDYYNSRFTPLSEEIEAFLKDLPLDQLVLKCLDLSHDFYSQIKGMDSYQCTPNRKRSSFDLWRHCKVFIPDCTVYQVMDILFKNRDKISCWFCCTVEARVFKLHKYWENGVSVYKKYDEFGLQFNDWEDISPEKDLTCIHERCGDFLNE